ncbi:MAG: hypothetical protein H7318_06355 [Oligoflexus sp.]|nr:hypothetical protein [Oligoflexus sp.]
MFSLKLILAGALLFGGASLSFAGESKEPAASSERKKIAHPKAHKKARVKAKIKKAALTEANSGKPRKKHAKKKLESSTMFPPDDH